MADEQMIAGEGALEPAGQPAVEEDATRDEPMDATVYEVHPAVRTDYPYAAGFSGPADQLNLLDVAQRMALPFSFKTEPAKYKVPQRFGMSAILGIMTALAILFGALHFLNADPFVYLFFGIQSLVICLMQMFNGKAPRAASAIVGAIMAPLFATQLIESSGVYTFYEPGERIVWTIGLIPLTVPLGVLLGYLTGACAAGVFLVMDYLEQYLQSHGWSSSSPSSN